MSNHRLVDSQRDLHGFRKRVGRGRHLHGVRRGLMDGCHTAASATTARGAEQRRRRKASCQQPEFVPLIYSLPPETESDEGKRKGERVERL